MDPNIVGLLHRHTQCLFVWSPLQNLPTRNLPQTRKMSYIGSFAVEARKLEHSKMPLEAAATKMGSQKKTKETRNTSMNHPIYVFQLLVEPAVYRRPNVKSSIPNICVYIETHTINAYIHIFIYYTHI